MNNEKVKCYNGAIIAICILLVLQLFRQQNVKLLYNTPRVNISAKREITILLYYATLKDWLISCFIDLRMQ